MKRIALFSVIEDKNLPIFAIVGNDAPTAAPIGPNTNAPTLAPAISGLSLAAVFATLRSLLILSVAFVASWTNPMPIFPASVDWSNVSNATLPRVSGEALPIKRR